MNTMHRHFLLLLSFLMGISASAFEDGQTIRLVNRGRSVFVENSSLDENKNAVLWTETNVNAQRWTLSVKTNGTFLLQNDYTGFYLSGLTSGSSGNVGQVSKTATTSKGSWDFVPVEGTEDQYYIFQGTTQKYALAAADNVYDGSPLTIVNTATAKNLDSTRIKWTVEVVEPMAKAFTKDKRDDMMEKWKARCYKKAGTGWVIGNGGWWGDAEMFEIVLDALETTGNQEYATMFDNLYTNFIARNNSTWYQKGVSGYNEYNDDIAWMCIACVRAYLLTGQAKYRTTAKTNFDGMFKRADCYGNDLLQWKHGSGTGTNSCINGPAAVCACYLAIAQADTTYFQKARKTYMAERGKLFEMSNGKPTGKIWDSYDQGNNSYNYWASTYNQGTNLGAAILLYKHYGEQIFKDDADAIIKWSEANMANSKGLIHVCQTVSGDLCNFKGIMLRYLRLYAETFNAPSHYDWIAKNAYHAWNNRNSSGITSSAWLSKAEEDFKHKEGDSYKNFGNDGNMTCVSAAFNCHLGAVLEHDAYEKNEAEDFNYVRNAPVTYEGNADEDNGGMVGPMKSSNYIGYRRVNFGDKPASHIDLRLNITVAATTLNVYLDEPNEKQGTLLCTISGSELSAIKTWNTIRKMINQPVVGEHEVYFVSKGTGRSSVNWWQFQSLNPVYGDLTNGGGKLSASFESDTQSALTDGDITTVCNASVEGETEAWIEYASPSPMKVYGYQVFSGEVDGSPKGWILQASSDGNDWQMLHQLPDTTFTVCGQRIFADVATDKAYTHYRLLIRLDESQANLSLSEWQLLGRCIDATDLTADGGSTSEGSESLTDHVGTTLSSAPISAVYQPAGNYMLTAYSITVGEASQAPTSWKLEGSPNGTTWKVIDQQTDATFPYDNYTTVIRVSPVSSYLYYRLTIGDETAEITQWQLFGAYDFGNFYADITPFSTILASGDADAISLTDKDGTTFAALEGEEMYWDILTPLPVKLIAYSAISADDASHDPQSITVLGLDDAGTETKLSSKETTFAARGYRLSNSITTASTFKHFRIKPENETGKVQLADLELYGTTIAETDEPSLMTPTNVEASAEGLSSTELIGRLADGVRTSHYRASFAEPVAITYSFEEPILANAYSITASRNELKRDPAAWVLEGSLDNETWTELDRQSDQLFSHRYATQFYPVPTATPYSTYRLTITAVNGADQLQIGEWQLLQLGGTDPTGISSIRDSQFIMQNEKIGNRTVSLTSRDSDGFDKCYNLVGQRLSKPQRGINIVNGRKVLVK